MDTFNNNQRKLKKLKSVSSNIEVNFSMDAK